MKIEDLNLDVRAFNAVCRAGFKTAEELKQLLSDDPEALRREIGSSTFDSIEEALVALPQPVEVVEQNVIVPPEYTRAMELHQMIMADKQIIENGLYRMGKHLKEMRDGKLYKQHGYQNFEDYCKNSVGFNRNQAYAYIRITEKLPEDFVSSTIQIGVQKLSLLAMLDEPTRETVIETVDIESATVRELKAQITALSAERDENEHAAALLSEELDSAKESLASKSKQFKEAMESKDRQLQAAKDAKESAMSKCNHLNSVIREKESRIKELEDAPVMHDITDTDLAEENKRLKRELEDEQLRVISLEKAGEAKARKAADEVRHEMTQMHETELQTLKDGYEKQLAEAQKSEADHAALNREHFEALETMFEHAVDELENFLEDVQNRKERIGYIKNLDKYFRDAILDQIDN